jgi:type VI secretion system protein ImpK
LDRLNQATGECFTAIVQLRQLDDASLPPAEAVHRRLRSFVDAMMTRAAQAGFAREDVDDIAYALVALADEVAASKEPLRALWASQPLQLLYFHENVAGENFFTRLEAVRRDPRRREALRAYALALLLGFQGRFRVRGGELELLSLTEDLQRELGRGRGVDVETLSPHGERPERAGARGARRDPAPWIALGALVLVVLVVVGLRLWLGASTSSVVQRIAGANLP